MNAIVVCLTLLAGSGLGLPGFLGLAGPPTEYLRINAQLVEIRPDGSREVCQLTGMSPVPQHGHAGEFTGFQGSATWKVRLSKTQNDQLAAEVSVTNKRTEFSFGPFVSQQHRTYSHQGRVTMGQIHRWVQSHDSDGRPTCWIEFSFEPFQQKPAAAP